MQNILATFSVAMATALCVMVLFRRRFTLTDAALLTGLTGLAGVEVLDWLALNHSEDVLGLERWRLALQGLAFWAWFGFSLVFARTYQDTPASKIQIGFFIAGLALPVIPAFMPANALLGPVSQDDAWIIPLTKAGFYHHLGLLLSVLLCMYNLEATLAGATHVKRWRIKFFVLGVMALLAAQFLAASEGMLYGILDLSLNPTRQVGLVLGGLMMGYSFLTRGGEEKIIFSRRLAYKSLVLFAAGLYLVGIGLTGQTMWVVDTRNNSTLVMALGIMGGLVFLVVLLSETLRRKAKLALRKYFYQDKYDYRIQWLDFTRRLSAAHQRQDLYQAVLLGFCENLGMGQGALYLRGLGEQDFEPVHQCEMAQANTPLPADHPLCQPSSRRLGVKDLRKELPIPPAPAASFFVQLTLNQNMEGFILLDRPFNPNEEYDDEDFELMEALAHQASLAILNMRLVDELAEAREMEIMGKVSSFVLHDLKNLVYTLSLILENAKNYIKEPEFQRDLLTSLGNTVSKMNMLISQLSGLPMRESLHREDTDLLDLAKESAKALHSDTFQVKGDPVPALVDRKEIHKVLVNLLRNAQEACQGNNPVTVEVGHQGQPFVKVSDKGCGMEQEFIRKHLFVPFKTTKDNGMGIGLYQSKQIVEAHGGRLEVESAPGRGSTFTMLLPNNQSSYSPDVSNAKLARG